MQGCIRSIANTHGGELSLLEQAWTTRDSRSRDTRRDWRLPHVARKCRHSFFALYHPIDITRPPTTHRLQTTSQLAMSTGISTIHTLLQNLHFLCLSVPTTPKVR